MSNNADQLERHLYWLEKEDFLWAKDYLTKQGYNLVAATMTPCQVMRASDKKVYFATPGLWSFMCNRQGSWYRASPRNGQFMMMSENRLPEAMERFRDAELGVSDFQPESLPTDAELAEVVASDEYQQGKPSDWEGIGLKDAVMFKTLFTVNGFWRRGDTLKEHWVGHKANHANFLAKRFTTEIDGEAVPYSLTENSRVCSSCAEFFNLASPDSRKLVRSCPGAVTFAKAPKDVYVDVRPVKGKVAESPTEQSGQQEDPA